MDFEDNSKLFVFDKKEVILIFVFVVVIIVTSFTLGVRVGKGLSLKSDGYTKEDISKTVDLKSVEEEQADNIVNDTSFEGSLSDDKTDTQSKLDDLADPERLDKEFSGISNDSEDSLESQMPSDLKKKTTELDKKVEEAVAKELTPKEGNQLQGKFTINLASKKTRAEAEEYAAPYMASDLEVVINKVNTVSKGTWYRIGVGVFDSYDNAKSFLEKNPIFFKGKKYWITEIK